MVMPVKSNKDAKENSSSDQQIETKGKKSFSYWGIYSQLAAGGAAGTVAATLTFPFEGMKKRKQSKQRPIGFKFKMPSTWAPSLKKLYTGCSSFAASVGPTTVVQSGSYELLTQNPFFKEHNVLTAAVSGGAGAICSSLVEGTILTQQLQRQVGMPHDPISAIKILFRYGWLKPWTGLLPLAVRESVFGSLAISLSDKFAEGCEKKFGPYAYLPGQIVIGAGGALATHPADTVATKLQHNLHKGIKKPITNVIADVFQEEGIKGFYKGGGYRVCLFTGCMLVISKIRKPIEETINQSFKK